jgi:hypothetical protein
LIFNRFVEKTELYHALVSAHAKCFHFFETPLNKFFTQWLFLTQKPSHQPYNLAGNAAESHATMYANMRLIAFPTMQPFLHA